MKAADIDRGDLIAVVHHVGQVKTAEGGFGAAWVNVGEVCAHFPGFPEKVVLAKLRKVIRGGYLSGCCCGCRGDFEVTAAGLEQLGLPAPLDNLELTLYGNLVGVDWEGTSLVMVRKRITDERLTPAEVREKLRAA